MTRDELTDLTKEAGVGFVFPCGPAAHELDFLERLVNLATAKEREACAQAVETTPWVDGGRIPSNRTLAAVIRARSQ